MAGIELHNDEIQRNLSIWNSKPVLRQIYRRFHEVIAGHLARDVRGEVVELGAGVADISEVIPGCIRTDLFPNPWIDRVENAYELSFDDGSISNIILFDVFHHLRYPGHAMAQFHRVLANGGRVLIFEPCMSVLGRLVYSMLHQEPLRADEKITWDAPPGWSPSQIDYYAAQGNASRIFLRKEVDVSSLGWKTITIVRLSAISYVASGGYSKRQMFPDKALGAMQFLDRMCDKLPGLFATRMLVVLEKNAVRKAQGTDRPN
jgi:SAM-dependent methyltransferase